MRRANRSACDPDRAILGTIIRAAGGTSRTASTAARNDTIGAHERGASARGGDCGGNDGR